MEPHKAVVLLIHTDAALTHSAKMPEAHFLDMHDCTFLIEIALHDLHPSGFVGIVAGAGNIPHLRHVCLPVSHEWWFSWVCHHPRQLILYLCEIHYLTDHVVGALHRVTTFRLRLIHPVSRVDDGHVDGITQPYLPCRLQNVVDTLTAVGIYDEEMALMTMDDDMDDMPLIGPATYEEAIARIEVAEKDCEERNGTPWNAVMQEAKDLVKSKYGTAIY